MGNFIKLVTMKQAISGDGPRLGLLLSILHRESVWSPQGIFLRSPIIGSSDALLRFTFVSVSLAESGFFKCKPWTLPQRVQFCWSALHAKVLIQVDPRPYLEKMPEVTLRIRGFL